MKLGPVTKFDKRNTATSNKFDDSALSPNFDVTVIFSSHGQFGAIWNPYSGGWSVKLTFPLKVTFYLTKSENRTKKSLTQLSYYSFE